MRYFFSWAPLVIVTTVILLALPWLGVIAFVLVSAAALAVLAGAIVAVPYMLGRAATRRWQANRASPRTATALSAATSGTQRTRIVPEAATLLLPTAAGRRDA